MTDASAPRGFAGVLLSIANRLDEGESAPALQKTQTVMLIALFLDLCWPTLAGLVL